MHNIVIFKPSLLWKIIKNWNSKFRLVFGQFLISSWSEKGHEPSRDELKILQLELWLEPARLGLITTMYACLWYWRLIIYVKLFSHEDQVLIDDKMHQWTVTAKRIWDRSIVSSINPKFDNRFIVFCTSWELYVFLFRILILHKNALSWPFSINWPVQYLKAGIHGVKFVC